MFFGVKLNIVLTATKVHLRKLKPPWDNTYPLGEVFSTTCVRSKTIQAQGRKVACSHRVLTSNKWSALLDEAL